MFSRPMLPSPASSRQKSTVRLLGVFWLSLLAVLAMTLSARAQGTYFLDDSRTFSALNDHSYQNFTVTGGNISYDLRFVSDYKATCAIISNSNLQAFLDGSGVPTYAVFNDQFGLDHDVTLGPGSYSVVMRNDVNASNTVRYELDTIIDFSNNSDFYDTYFSRNDTVGANGGTYWQTFTVQDGFRYWIDGANSGLKVYIIPANQLSNFTSGATFNYYTDYSSDAVSMDLPGGYEIKLPAGDYVLAARNPATIGKAIQFDCSRWKIRSGSSSSDAGGITTSGGAKWVVNGSGKVKIKIGTVVNHNTTTSGSLRIELYASASPYTGQSTDAYLLGTLNLNPLPAHYQYAPAVGKSPYTPPPHGSYYTCLLLEENTEDAGWVVRDFRTFASASEF